MNEMLLITETGSISQYKPDNVRPGCLGRLFGPIADFKDSTRNNRYYSKKLWEKVFDTPWVKEAIETKTLFGEADHPSDRLETNIKEAAVVLTDYKINEVDGVIDGSFDILDTPNGRILKSLADYGCRLGVSSRGRGKVIEKGTKQIVDENSYLFGGFDVVVLPAVSKARQSFMNEDFVPQSIESVSNMIESQIKQTSSASDLKVMKNILESTDSDDFDELIEMIDSRMSSMSCEDDTIIESALIEDLKDAYKKIAELSESRSDVNLNTTEEDVSSHLDLITDLIEEVASQQSTINGLREELSRRELREDNYKNSVNQYKERVANLIKQVNLGDTRSQVEIEDLKGRISDELQSKRQLEHRLSESINSHISTKAECDDLIGENDNLKGKVKSLMHKVDNLTEDIFRISNENLNLMESAEAFYKAYLNSRCTTLGVNPNLVERLVPNNPTPEAVNQIIQENASVKRRLNKLSFSTTDSNTRFTEEASREVQSDENPELSTARLMVESVRQSNTK